MTAYQFARLIDKDHLVALKTWNRTRANMAWRKVGETPKRNSPYLILDALDSDVEYRWRTAVDYYLARRIWVEIFERKRFKRSFIHEA